MTELHEHYQKGSYRNRCHILTAQGKARLSVPLEKGKHQQLPVREVRIAYDIPWYRQHWHAIQTAYGKAPFFAHYGHALRDILFSCPGSLAELNHNILVWLLSKTHAPGRLVSTETYLDSYTPPVIDFRNTITPAREESTAPYNQVFTDRLGFVPDLSALDLIMHLGPASYDYLSDNESLMTFAG